MPSAYRGVIGARFGCLQMGMREFGLRGPCYRTGGEPARGPGARGAAWPEPVNALINSLWTTSVDKRSRSVQKMPEVDRNSEFSSPATYEPVLAWTYSCCGGPQRRPGGKAVRRMDGRFASGPPLVVHDRRGPEVARTGAELAGRPGRRGQGREPAGNRRPRRPPVDLSAHVRPGGVTPGNGPGAGRGGHAGTRRTGPGFATIGAARKNQHAYGRFDGPRRRRGHAARGSGSRRLVAFESLFFTPHGEVADKWWSS